MDPSDVRRLNLYQEGDLTHYKQPLVDCHLQQCWDELVEKANVKARKVDIDKFNR
jgi:xanthine dehydrogenase/oxidase